MFKTGSFIALSLVAVGISGCTNHNGAAFAPRTQAQGAQMPREIVVRVDGQTNAADYAVNSTGCSVGQNDIQAIAPQLSWQSINGGQVISPQGGYPAPTSNQMYFVQKPSDYVAPSADQINQQQPEAQAFYGRGRVYGYGYGYYAYPGYAGYGGYAYNHYYPAAAVYNYGVYAYQPAYFSNLGYYYYQPSAYYPAAYGVSPYSYYAYAAWW